MRSRISGQPTPVEAEVHPERAGVLGRAGQVGRVDVHLGRDAADVEAGAAEGPALDQRDAPVVEAFVEDRVARSAADDAQVEVSGLGHAPMVPGRVISQLVACAGAVHPRSGPSPTPRSDIDPPRSVDPCISYGETGGLSSGGEPATVGRQVMSVSVKPRLADRQPSCDGGVPRVRTGPVGGRSASVEPRRTHDERDPALPTSRRPAPGDERGLSVRTRSLTSPYARPRPVAPHAPRGTHSHVPSAPAPEQAKPEPADPEQADPQDPTPPPPAEIATRLAGQHALWEPLVRYDPISRYYARLASEPDFEAWLLTWLPGQGTEWHDHGGSAGAFVVVRGELTERTATVSQVGPPRDRARSPGCSPTAPCAPSAPSTSTR